MNAFDLNEFLQRDGGKFKTVQVRSGEGVRLVNYNGDASRFARNDGTYFELPLYIDITAPNLIAGTRVQLYNNTKSVELDNVLVTGSGYTYSTQLGVAYNIEVGDEIRLRACWHSGTIAKLPVQSYGIATTGGLVFSDKQVDDEKHNELGYDGSLIDLDNSPDTGEVRADFANIQIDVNDPDNLFDSRKGIAWWRYITTTETGIRTYSPDAIQYNPDAYNILVTGPIQVENTKADPLRVINGVWTRADGGDIIASTSNSIWWVPDNRVYQAPNVENLENTVADAVWSYEL